MAAHEKAAFGAQPETRPAIQGDDDTHLKILRRLAQVPPPNLAYRADAERLTDECGAVLLRTLTWPRRRVIRCGAAFPEEIDTLRVLIDGGDEALVIGPTEGFAILPTARFFDLLVATGRAHGAR